MSEKIYLVDGSALIFRAHYALIRNPLMTSEGVNVSAVFGFAQTLFSILQGEAGYAAVAFDTGAPTFRHERYKEYKAHRPPAPEELVAQIPMVRELVKTIGLKVLERDGVEADDLIASLATTISKQGGEAVIVSSDKDFNQLVGPSVHQWIPPRGRKEATLLGVDEVTEKWGVPPERTLDVLALMGDSVDNVPGVKGVGEKTACDLIQRYGDLDNLYAQLDSVKRASVREKLREHKDDAFLSRELIRLKVDLMPDERIEEYRIPDIRERPGLLELLQRLEFRRLIDQLDLRPKKIWSSDYRTIVDRAELHVLLAKVKRTHAPLAIDTETDSLDARCARAVGVSFSWEPGVAYYVPLSHQSGPNMAESDLVDELGAVLEDEQIEKVGQNLKFDLHVLEGIGLTIRGRLFDTLLASYLIDPDRRHDLDSLTLEKLGHTKIPTVELIGKGKTQTTMDKLPVETVRDYAAEDADAALRLHSILLQELRDRGQEDLFREIEVPLVPVLVSMERLGVHLEPSVLEALSTEMESELSRLSSDVFRQAGEEFNINSPAQLSEVLFERLKLPHGKKTKTGYSTDSEYLESLAPDAPIVRSVLDFRAVSKLRSTYLETLPKQIDPETGRIHGQFHQHVAATGRLSSSGPNLQNIPIRTSQGRRIRTAFTPQRKEDILLSADYSQIELRVLAHLSQDPGLISAFNAGEDIHAATAARIFDVDVESVDPDMRGRAKTVNFGVLYGMGPHRLSRSLGIPFKEARDFIEQYFAKMPGVKGYLKESVEKARADGYVSTVLGRRRYLPALQAEGARARAGAERIAANTPIQGSAADLIKKAMIGIHEAIAKRGLKSRMILQVHDELLFEGPGKEREELSSLVKETMETVVDMAVPLKVDIGWGSNWNEAHG